MKFKWFVGFVLLAAASVATWQYWKQLEREALPPEVQVEEIEEMDPDSWPGMVEPALAILADSLLLDSQTVAFMLENEFTRTWGLRYVQEPGFRDMVFTLFDSLRYEGFPVDRLLLNFLSHQPDFSDTSLRFDNKRALLIDVALSHAVLACKQWLDWGMFNPADHLVVFKRRSLVLKRPDNYLDSISGLRIRDLYKRGFQDSIYEGLVLQFKEVYAESLDTFVSPEGPLLNTLVEGDSSDRLPLVKARLHELGFGFYRDRSVRFTPELKYQLQRWQRQKGYIEDGKLGFESDEMLFLGRSRKLQKLALALERQRWMHQFVLGDRFVWVNLAAARVNLVSADSLVSFNTCSGRRPDKETDMRTPQMLSIVNYALAYPYWVAPTSIGEKELYPAVRKDPAYLKKHHYELVKGNKIVPDSTVNWKQLNPERIPFFFRQTPGLHNALGLMKFNIVNDMSIYMHDTPSKRAFGYSYRWVSHGCVRLEQPLEMARFLLAYNEPDEQRIPEVVYDESKRSEKDTFRGNEPVRIMLEEPVPVLFDYRCAWYDAWSGAYSYHCDIYEYDARLLAEAHRRGWDWAY
jgi:hypothetical protein